MFLNAVSRNEKYSNTFKINDCNNFNGFIGVFNEFEKEYFILKN